MAPQAFSLFCFSACNTVIIAGDSVKLAFSFLVKIGLDLVIVTPLLKPSMEVCDNRCRIWNQKTGY